MRENRRNAPADRARWRRVRLIINPSDMRSQRAPDFRSCPVPDIAQKRGQKLVGLIAATLGARPQRRLDSPIDEKTRVKRTADRRELISNGHRLSMMTMHGPSAATIRVNQVLDLLDSEFAEVAAAAGRRGFALWIGSGISLGRAPSVGMMLERALEHLRQNIEPGNPGCRFKRALDEALGMSNLSGAERAAIPLGDPVDSWPQKGSLIHSLWDLYASVLDIRVEGKADDYMLWNAVDVRTMFGTLADPDCEHLCIAILVMEGAIADIASANWDGLIERAVERLSGGGRLLQVVVDPDHLRDPAGRTRLIKFHGCAIYARDDPGTYRHFLTATRPQITDWPHNARLDALRTVLRSVATNSRTLMIGLSLQDTNLQDLFAAARRENAWPWPPAPPPQGHVFCADAIGTHQSNMLRVVYGAAYGRNRAAIEEGALIRVYSKQILLGLVLHILCAKLSSLATQGCGSRANQLTSVLGFAACETLLRCWPNRTARRS